MPFVPDNPPPSTGRFVPDAPAPRKAFDPIAAPDKLTADRRILQTPGGDVTLRNRDRAEVEQFVKDNAEPGTPLDTEAELPASTRARLSFESDPAMQVDLLTKQGLPSRLAKDGRTVIVRQDGKDVLLHPKTQDVSGGDVAGATFPLLKGAAGVATAAATGGASLPLQAALLGGSAAAVQGAGQGGSRILAGQPLDGVGEEALKEGALNAALPLAGAAVKGGANAIRSRILANQRPLEAALPDAAKRLGVETTAAETTGSPALAKLGKITPKEEASRQGVLKASQDRQIGPSGRSQVLSEDALAQKTKPIFSEAEQVAKQGTDTALSDASKAANAEIQASLDSGLVPTTKTNSEVGGYLRSKFDAFLQKVKDDAAKNYPAFHAKAAEEGVILDKKPITALAEKIKAEDPTDVIAKLAPSSKQVQDVGKALTKPLQEEMTDAAGNVTPEIPAPDMTFEDAIRLRSIVRTKLNSPTDPLGDVVKSYYKRLDGALTESIDDGLKRGSPELKKLYETARGSYAQGADALDRGVVQKLFRNVGETGRVPDEDVVRQVFSGPGKLTALQDMKNILDPQDYKLLLRSGLNSIVAESKAGGQLIDAGKFLNRLNALDPEVRAEVLGPQLEKSLRANATLLNRAQGTKVPAAELQDALAQGSRAGPLLENAIAREESHNRIFNSTVQTRLRNGVLDPKTANDDRFVSYLMGDGVSAADTRQALTQVAAMSPETAEQIRQRVLQNVIDETGAKPPLGKITTGIADADPAKLVEVLKPGLPSREKLQAAVGKEGLQFLDDLATYAEATAKRQVNESGRHVAPETLAKEGGSAALGFKRNAVGAAVDLASIGARALGGGRIVRSEAFKQWLETGELPTLGGKIGKAAILSSPETVPAGRALEK